MTAQFWCCSGSINIPKSAGTFVPKNIHCIIAATPNSQRTLFHRETNLPYHSTTIKLLPPLKLIEGFISSPSAFLKHCEVIISHVTAVARKFKRGGHRSELAENTPERLIQTLASNLLLSSKPIMWMSGLWVC
jgi:hypothetical protein